jgi:hypothetical protein
MIQMYYASRYFVVSNTSYLFEIMKRGVFDFCLKNNKILKESDKNTKTKAEMW